MDNAPRFVEEEQFDPRRLRLGDIDGSGTNVLCEWRWCPGMFQPMRKFLGRASADRLISHGGRPQQRAGFGFARQRYSVSSTSPSPLTAESQTPLRYIDLMGGNKPHLMVHVRNNLGAETHIRYAASTYFYVQDKLSGRPWVTLLPHVVHVVHRTETFDFIGRSRFVSKIRRSPRILRWNRARVSRLWHCRAMGHRIALERFRFSQGGGFQLGRRWWSPPTHTRGWFTGAVGSAESIAVFRAWVSGGTRIARRSRYPCAGTL